MGNPTQRGTPRTGSDDTGRPGAARTGSDDAGRPGAAQILPPPLPQAKLQAEAKLPLLEDKSFSSWLVRGEG